jgi:hypothetical protein
LDSVPYILQLPNLLVFVFVITSLATFMGTISTKISFKKENPQIVSEPLVQIPPQQSFTPPPLLKKTLMSSSNHRLDSLKSTILDLRRQDEKKKEMEQLQSRFNLKEIEM